MFLVVGDTEYTEASYVNHPADKHAMNLHVEALMSKQTDETTSEFIALDDSLEPQMQLTLVDSLEPEASPVVLTDDAATPPIDNSQEVDPEPQPTSDIDEKTTLEEAFRVLFEDKDNLTEDHVDILNEIIETELEEDAKLSPEKRKGLPAKVFCGPNRSFPVNDCAHYTAAKRLIGRYQGPGDKSKILSCIESRGKKLSCSGSKKKDEQDKILCLDCMSDEVLTQTIKDGIELFEAKGLDILGLLPSVVKEIDQKDEQISKLQENVEALSTSICSLEISESVLRQEWKEMVVQCETSDSVLKEAVETALETSRSYASLVLSLTEKDTSAEEIENKVKELSSEALLKLVRESDLSDAINLVRGGISNEPVEPVTLADAEPADVMPREDTGKEFLDRIESYVQKYGREWAGRFIDGQARRGNVVNEEVLAKAWELVAK